MIGKQIADLIMQPKKQSFSDGIDFLEKEGFSDALEDYFNVWNKTRFRVKSGDIWILGEYIKNPAAADNRVMVICHGQGATRALDIGYGKLYYDLGFNLVLFDERSFGESGGEFCTLGMKEQKDIKEVLKYTREIFGSDAILGMHGESMGAASELLLLDTERPDFVVADCPFADTGLLIDDLAKKYAGPLAGLGTKSARKIGLKRRDYDFRTVRPIDSVKDSPVPICFVHGKSDSLIDCKHSKMMYEASKNPLSELHLVDGADHAQCVYRIREEYFGFVAAFVKKVLASIK